MKYRFTSEITVSSVTEVEADSYEEAMEIAEDREGALDFNGAGVSINESWVVDDIDGSPNNITLAE